MIVSQHDVDRVVSWVGTVSDIISTNGPTIFSCGDLAQQTHLFAHRAALFYTPTENVPPEYVGSGDLILSVPVVTPDLTTL